MTGKVNPQLEAVIPVEVRGSGGRTETIPFVLDTGFDGFLALPPERIASLGLQDPDLQVVTLGDGSPALLRLFRAAARWHGRFAGVHVLEVDDGALLGMALLRGSLLTMSVAEGGLVRVEPIPE